MIVEKWTSEEAAEVHLFRENDQRGFAYVLGFNPALFPEDDVRAFLAAHGIDWP